MSKFIIVSLICLSWTFLFSNISIVYSPVNSIDDEMELLVNNFNTKITSLKIFYRTDLQNEFSSFELLQEPSRDNFFKISFRNLLENEYLNNFNYISYYIQIIDEDNQFVTSPSLNPSLNAYKLINNKKYLRDSFVLISPDDTKKLINNQNIVFSFFSEKESLDKNSIQVFLNNKNITHRAKIYESLIVFTIPENQTQSIITLKATLKTGEIITSKEWNFSTIKKDTILNSIDYFGNISFINNSGHLYNNDSDISSFDNNSTQVGIINFSAIYKKFILKNYLFISSLEDKNKQKVNKYYIGLFTPYAKFHLGDYSPNYSEFTVNNRSVYGLTGEITFEHFSLMITHGELNRKIPAYQTESSYRLPTFKRDNTSLKILLGNKKSSSFSINVSKNKDKLSSLDESDYKKIIDDTEIDIVQAKDNIILGADFQLSFFSRKLNFFGEAAMSMFNSNINSGVISKDSLESYIDSDIPFDPETFENIIIINKNMEPFSPGMTNSALKIGSRANFFRNSLNISFTQIGPSFHSLSSTSVIQDKRIFRISDNVLISNEIFFTAGFEFAQDNIVNQKDVTINSNNFFLSLNYQPFNLPYYNFYVMQNTNKDDLKEKVNNYSNQYFSFNSGYSRIQFSFAQTDIHLSYGLGLDKDKSNNDFFDDKRHDFGINSNLRFRDYPLVTRVGVSYSLKNTQDDDSLTFTNLFINNQYSLFNNKLLPYFNYRIGFNSGDQDKTNTHLISFGSRYRPYKNTFLNLDIGYKVFNSDSQEFDNDYNYFFTKFIVTQNF